MIVSERVFGVLYILFSFVSSSFAAAFFLFMVPVSLLLLSASFYHSHPLSLIPSRPLALRTASSISPPLSLLPYFIIFFLLLLVFLFRSRLSLLPPFR